jgi:hypothetical protein
MIHGAHVIVYSKDSDADRDFFRDVLEYPFVDVGHGWLIFALPPAEVAVHPSDGDEKHELYFMCDDVHAFIAKMRAHDVACSEVHEERWGSLTHLTLPGGGKIGVYQPKHPSPTPKVVTKAPARAKAGPPAKARPKATKKKAPARPAKTRKKAPKRRA